MPVKWKNQKLLDQTLLVFLLLCAIALFVWSRQTAAAMTEALQLCMQILLPSLYPFFVLSNLLISSGAARQLAKKVQPLTVALFGLPGCFAPAILLGIVGGYPVGAKTVSGLYSKHLCTKQQAIQALRFCNNAGPAFLISAVGAGLLKDVRLGVLIYGLHLISAMMIGIINHDKSISVKDKPITDYPMETQSMIRMFLNAVTDAFQTFLHVCAFVLLFAVVMCIVRQLPGFHDLPEFWQGLLCGSLELTSGTARLANADLPRKFLISSLCFLCGWGGCSVQLQTVSILQEAGLPCRDYLKAKLLHGLLSAGIALLLC